MYGLGIAGVVLGWASPAGGLLSGDQGSRAVLTLLAALTGCLVGWGAGWSATFLLQAGRRVMPRRH